MPTAEFSKFVGILSAMHLQLYNPPIHHAPIFLKGSLVLPCPLCSHWWAIYPAMPYLLEGCMISLSGKFLPCRWLCPTHFFYTPYSPSQQFIPEWPCQGQAEMSCLGFGRAMGSLLLCNLCSLFSSSWRESLQRWRQPAEGSRAEDKAKTEPQNKFGFLNLVAHEASFTQWLYQLQESIYFLC